MAGTSAAAATGAGITGNPEAWNSEARLTANSRYADSLGSAMNLSTSSRATVENAGAGSRVVPSRGHVAGQVRPAVRAGAGVFEHAVPASPRS